MKDNPRFAMTLLSNDFRYEAAGNDLKPALQHIQNISLVCEPACLREWNGQDYEPRYIALKGYLFEQMKDGL